MRIADLRILIAVVWLTALLSQRFVDASNETRDNLTRSIRDTSFHGTSLWSQEDQINKRPLGLTYREMQNVLRHEGGEEGLPVDCCPTVKEIIEPIGGRNRDEMYVELYRNDDQVQRFYEYSCRQDVLDKPCRFIDRKLMNQSRCVQKYSYSYAMVRDPSAEITTMENGNTEHHHRHRHKDHHFPTFGYGSPWTLDHIRVRSGCSCEISPKPKKKRPSSLKTKKIKHRPSKKKDDFTINSDT
ncbi:uncharacterized protein LOC103579862 [Microplitis demolitor]|uniref:uncharacterized protein LOC103579862 n=1 Tax=Microplitis demolitor TaxID=69319 RepID=UPI00043FFF7C|nr:uncharacterized protein LOC103579862 [Microplitis demolitor]